MTTPASPTALDLLKRAESYLSALHGSVARHDNLAANLGCAGCELRDKIRNELAAIDWTDGHPQLEAIAAAVWEQCGRSDNGSCVEDDPRNIAAAALAAVLPPPADSAAEEAYRLALSTALGLGTAANWEAIRDRAEDLTAEVEQLTETSRRLLEQRQEMAAERFVWQERGDRAEARVRQLEAAAPVDRATVEEHRLALSDALGLGTGAPWDAIRDRVTELALPPLGQDPVARRLGLVAEHRATVLNEAAEVAESFDIDASPQAVAAELRSLADEERAEREAQAHLDQLADELPPAPAADRAALSAKLWQIAWHHIVAEWICCEPLDPEHDLCAKGYAALEMAKALLVDSDPEEAWNPAAPLLDAVLAELGAAASCPDPIECGHEAALGQAQTAVAELAQALRLTREYFGEELLPPVEGWSWYDALRRHAPHELPAVVPAGAGETSCPGFPDGCPTLIAVVPTVGSTHGGGLRCGCYDEKSTP
jgi:hypothetical protein